MACYKPLSAWRNPSDPTGQLLFSYHTIGGSAQHAERTCLKIPCGQCVGCRLEYSRQWAVRCCHESSLHIFNCFITQTQSGIIVIKVQYNGEHLLVNERLLWRYVISTNRFFSLISKTCFV